MKTRSRHSIRIIVFIIFLPLCTSAQKLPKPLRLGFNIQFGQINLEKMKEAKAAGIDCIEIGMGGIVDTSRSFLKADAALIEEAKKVKKAADDAGIQIWSVHMPFGKNIDLSLTNEKDRQEVIAVHMRILNYVKILNPHIILFHPSWFLNLNEREQRTEQFIRSATTLNNAVKSQGAEMVIENMLGPELKHGRVRERPLLRTVDEAVKIMNRLPPDVYSAIDLNHIKYPEQLILAMGKRLKTLHVADGTGREENHYFPCNGKGENNWVAILQALNKVGYDGPFMYESHTTNINGYKECYQSLYDAAFNSVAPLDKTLSEKNFPFLNTLLQNPSVYTPFQSSAKTMNKTYADRIQNALKNCPAKDCYANALQLSPIEVKEVGNKWAKEYSNNKAFRSLIATLKQNGSYYLYNNLSDTAYIRKVWETEASDINRIFNIYQGRIPPLCKN